VESFNATLRRECLHAHWFESLLTSSRKTGPAKTGTMC
jgi:hypothetical protein